MTVVRKHLLLIALVLMHAEESGDSKTLGACGRDELNGNGGRLC